MIKKFQKQATVNEWNLKEKIFHKYKYKKLNKKKREKGYSRVSATKT